MGIYYNHQLKSLLEDGGGAPLLLVFPVDLDD